MKHAYFKMAVKFRLRQSGLSTQNVTETNYAGHFGLLPQAVLFFLWLIMQTGAEMGRFSRRFENPPAEMHTVFTSDAH